MTEKIKQYCVFAKESVDRMQGSRGKLATQAGHAYVHSAWDSADRFPDFVHRYRETERAYKITLVVDTVEELETLRDHYHGICGVSLVTDAGFTVFKDADGNPCPVTTCLGIGPLPDSLKDEVLAKLKPLL